MRRLTHGERPFTIGAMSHPLQDVDLWLVDSLVVPVSLHGLDGRFVHANAAAERACGYSNAELPAGVITPAISRPARQHSARSLKPGADRHEAEAARDGPGRRP